MNIKEKIFGAVKGVLLSILSNLIFAISLLIISVVIYYLSSFIEVIPIIGKAITYSFFNVDSIIPEVFSCVTSYSIIKWIINKWAKTESETNYIHLTIFAVLLITHIPSFVINLLSENSIRANIAMIIYALFFITK